MKPTNFLPNFPKTLFGSAKRKSQDTLRLKAEALMARSFGGFTYQFASLLPAIFLSEISTDKRERAYSQLVTFWAWISQVLHFNAQVQAWREEAGLAPVSSSNTAYTKARKRLPLEFIESTSQHVVDKMSRRIQSDDLYMGLPVFSVDGSSVQLMDTPVNQAKYPQPTNQKKDCGFPVMKVLGVLNHSSGAWEHHVTAHPDEHDAKTMKKLIECFNEPCLLLADRAFCSYEIILRLKEREAQSIMKLHQMRAKGFTLRKGKRIGKNQRLVTWLKPKKKPKHSELSDAEWDDLAGEIQMRMIVNWYKDRNGEKKKMILCTTLLDAEKYDTIDITNLYAARWEIELRLRDVKTTMGMEALEVKSPEMAEKAMAMALLGFNLIKGVTQEASQQESVDKDLISFKGVLDWVNSSQSLFKELAKKTRQHYVKRYKSFLQIAASKLMNIRPYRWEPRAIKKRPKPFPRLQESRAKLKQDRENGKLIPALS